MSRVLVVDDHAAFRRAFAFLLGRGSTVAAVDQAGSAAEARPLLAAADVLVADDHLPDGDGAGLVAEFLALRPGAVAAVMSGSASPEEHARATGEGAITVLDKLDPTEVLVRTVCRLAGLAGPPPLTAADPGAA